MISSSCEIILLFFIKKKKQKNHRFIFLVTNIKKTERKVTEKSEQGKGN